MEKTKCDVIKLGPAVLMFICHVVCGQDPAATSNSIAYVGGTATIACPLTGSYTYPTWVGPPGGVFPYTSGSLINPDVSDSVSWAANNQDLTRTGVTTADAGDYACDTFIDAVPKQGLHTLHVRVLPDLPVISNTEIIGGVSSVRGTEDEEVTLTCVCQGGFPAPTLAWYRDTVTSAPVGTPGTDGTTYVTVTYTFPPGSSDDKINYICQSSFPDPKPAQPINQTSVQLYLNLKPSAPTVTQNGAATAGSTTILRCETSGFRPAASISLSWRYNNMDYTGHQYSTQKFENDKFKATSTLELTVQSRDNGRDAQCNVNHTTLSSPRAGYTVMIVHFKPVSATVSGNTQTEVGGTTPLTLTCSVGDANPTANHFTWTGPLLGHELQTVTLTPTRDHDGLAVTCTAKNTAGSTTSPPVILDLTYHPITNISEGTSVTKTEGDAGLVLHCSTDSKPVSTITWSPNNNNQVIQETNINNLNVGTVDRTDYGTYTCSADNGITGTTADMEKSVTLNVLFPPRTVWLTGENPGMVANGANTMKLTCTADYSRPMSTIVWSPVISGSKSTVIPGSQYGGTRYRETLTLTPTRSDDGTNITCSAWNNVTTQPLPKTVKLDLRYHPITTITEGTSITKTEGDTGFVLHCSTDSKPVSTITWSPNNNNQVMQETNNNQLNYSVGTVDRTDAGTYRCKADNNITGTTADREKSVTLAVLYPPDVTATGYDGTVNNASVTITCSPSGVPDNYTYYSWVHSWSNGQVISQPELPATQTLTLTRLTYQHSGVYTCRVSNGVAPYGTSDIIRQGSTSSITIKSHPVIDDSDLGVDKVHKLSTKLHREIRINITYYSNVDGTNVSCHQVVNNVTKSESVGVVTTETAVMQLTMLDGSTVPASGTRATVTLMIDHESELGFYQVKLRNTIGTKIVDLQIQSIGPPEPPENPEVSVVSTTSVNVSWNLGFHGGLDQTFVVQYSTDDKVWTNGTTLYTGLSVSRDRHHVSLDSLSPGQLYYLKIYAYNDKGKSISTVTLTTSTPEEPTSSNVAAIAGAAGGCGLALIIVVVVAVFIFWRRRSRSNEKPPKDTSLMLNNRHIDAQEDDDEGIRDNPTYVSADIVHAGPNTAQPQGVGNAGGAAGTGDVYAVVDKPKKPMPLNNSDPVYSVVDKSKPVKAGTSNDTSGVDKTLPLDPSAIYSIVDKNTPVKGGAAGTGDVYAVVDKPKKPMPLDPNAVYSDVEKPVKDSKTKDKNEKKKKGDKKEKKPKEKKADKKTKGGKGKKSSTPTTVAGTEYENAPDMYMNAPNVKTGDKENVYENPEVSKPKLAPKPQPSRNKNEDGLIYLDVELTTKKEGGGRQLVIHGEAATDYAIVEIGKVGAQYPESDNEGEKEEKKK